MPLRGNKYFNYYKRYFMDKINDKDIKKIFILNMKIPQITLTDYLSSDCYNKSEKMFFSYFILNAWNLFDYFFSFYNS